jgi:hypothetical protein
MALAALTGDEQCIIFSQLCNALDTRIAVAFGSTSSELRAVTRAPRQQLRADHEAAAALCRKMAEGSCKSLRKATIVRCWSKGLSAEEWSTLGTLGSVLPAPESKGLSADDLATLGTLGSVLPALEELHLIEPTAGTDGVQRLAERLGAGALPALSVLELSHMHVGDAGASALAAALGRGALPRLKVLFLVNATIGDAALVALAPALRRRPALQVLGLIGNPFGDEGLAALVAPPPPPAGAPPPPAGGLKKLETLNLSHTQVTDAGCAALAAALGSGALPALDNLNLCDTRLASAAAISAVYAARDGLCAW